MKKFLLILMVSMLGISCAKKEVSSKAKFKIFSGNMADTQTIFPSGLLVMGRSTDGLQSFIISYQPDIELELVKGDWEFATIGWMGLSTDEGPMTGNQQCSFKTVKIDTDIFTVDFEMSKQNCLITSTLEGNYFSHPMFYDFVDKSYDGFKKLYVQICPDFDLGCSAPTNPGSYIVEIPAHFKGILLNVDKSVTGIVSKCIPGGPSNLSPPYGGPLGFIGTKISTFATNDCTGDSKEYYFKHGFGEILKETENLDKLSIVKRAALSVDIFSGDVGVALATFYGLHSDLTTDPPSIPGEKALYLYKGEQRQIGGSTAISGNYLYFNGTNWTSITESHEVQLFLQDY